MKIKLTLTKSLAGCLVKQIATAHALGLKRVGDVTLQPDNPQTHGKIQKIRFLLKIEEVSA